MHTDGYANNEHIANHENNTNRADQHGGWGGSENDRSDTVHSGVNTNDSDDREGTDSHEASQAYNRTDQQWSNQQGLEQRQYEQQRRYEQHLECSTKQNDATGNANVNDSNKKSDDGYKPRWKATYDKLKRYRKFCRLLGSSFLVLGSMLKIHFSCYGTFLCCVVCSRFIIFSHWEVHVNARYVPTMCT
jgi:hypothetical protein